MALSRGNSRPPWRVAGLLSQAGLSNEAAAEAGGVLGLALASTGARRDGVTSTSEAVALAVKSGKPPLIAETGLAQAEALLAEAMPGKRSIRRSRRRRLWRAPAARRRSGAAGWWASRAAAAQARVQNPGLRRTSFETSCDLGTEVAL